MKVTITDFRCYSGTHEFYFDAGMTLICGPSGCGKSSILRAISFALYGTENSRVIAYGATTGKVELEIENMIIKRSCKPAHLTVRVADAEYEDDVAQAHIAGLFGNAFDVMSYIPQQASKLFLMRTSSEKLAVLEELLFSRDEESPAFMKKKCAALYRELEREYHELLGRQSILTQVLGEVVEAPAGDAGADDLTDDAANRRFLFLLSRQRIYTLYLQKCDWLTQTIVKYEDELGALGPDGDLALDEARRDALNNHQRALSKLEGLAWTQYLNYSVEDCEEMISICDAESDILRQFETLEKQYARENFDSLELEKARAEKEALVARAERIFNCPHCTRAVALINGGLEPPPENTECIDAALKEKRLTAARALVEKYEGKRARLDELSQALKSLGPRPEFSLADYSDQRRKWARYKENASIIQELKPHVLEGVTVAEARAELAALQRAEKNATRRSLLGAELEELRAQHNLLVLQAERQELRDDSVELESLSQRVHAKELFERKQREYAQYVERRTELAEFERARARLEHRMAAALELKQLITATEMEYIQSTIGQLTSLVNAYAAEIFADPPIVDVLLYGDDTKAKPRIDIEIFYKNNPTTFDALSGGEQARLNICFTLAFANHFRARLLLLDECTSQLNQDAAERVCATIHGSADCKVIMVAHQLVQGSFDQVISL